MKCRMAPSPFKQSIQLDVCQPRFRCACKREWSRQLRLTPSLAVGALVFPQRRKWLSNKSHALWMLLNAFAFAELPFPPLDEHISAD